MTRILYDERDFSLSAEGHAGAGERGSDLVCAAVSALMETLAAAVSARKEALRPRVLRAPGRYLVSCSPAKSQRALCRAVFRTVFTGLELVANQYPDFVSARKAGE